jgi:BMFP domain-containing protein YqiC
LTRGVVDGFTEASQAFSHELEGTNRFPDLMSRSVAAMIRANARLLDEVATAVRQAAAGWRQRPRGVTEEDFDYERLADLVAARIRSNASDSDGGA